MKQLPLRAVRDYQWLTVVRDPIGHFLSGWAECGDRENITSQDSYDTRIQDWLKRVNKKNRYWCAVHSLPQANFMFNASGDVDSRLVLVGDLQQLPDVLGLVGFEFNFTKKRGRNAGTNSFKKKHYPSRKDLISNATMRDICDFVAIDFFLFDFEPPEACKDLPLIREFEGFL
jgi:hypothetical protein